MEKENYLKGLENALLKSGKSDSFRFRCLEYANNLINQELPVIFDAKHFSQLLGMNYSDLNALINCKQDNLYKQVSIPKKSGGRRNILIPIHALKLIQKWILINILEHIEISKIAHGFCKGRSILTNASPHVGKDCIVNMDIENFFPTISIDKVFYIFYDLGYSDRISYILAKLSTFNGKIPQGSPASPAISNIVLKNTDKRILALADKYNASYSRYADDITISGSSSIISSIQLISTILYDEGFKTNETKTHVSFYYQHQEVTGISTNNGNLSISKRYKKRILQEIYYCKKFGVESHLKKIKCNKQFYKEHLFGKAYYIRMVEPEVGAEILNQLDEIIWSY